MPTIPKFNPPALLDDFDNIPNQRQGWSAYISAIFDAAISRVEADEVGPGNAQFYNQTKTSPDPVVERKVVWNAFPRTLVRRFGRSTALTLSDQLVPLGDPQLEQFFPGAQTRMQDEYCEWQVSRDPMTQKILRVTFTCEGPEYWQAIAGGPSIYTEENREPRDFGATGDLQVLLQLYRSILGNPSIKLDDLVVATPSGQLYNPWNKWNTTEGIVHLQQINNTLGAEIHIGADATVLHKKGGVPINDATRLICCSGFGGAERASDPSLGFEVNKLAAEGRRLTLRNPVGIYMDRLDDSGWTIPNSTPGGPRLPVGKWWKVLRGVPDAQGQPGTGMVVRTVYEVPAGVVGPDDQQLTVSDIHIGGVPITHGGQIAEHITMKFIALAGPAGERNNSAVECIAKCCRQNNVLQVRDKNAPCQDVFPAGPITMAVAPQAGIPRLSASRRTE